MKMLHRSFIVDAVIWDGTDDGLQELRDLGLDDREYHFQETASGAPRTLVLHSAEGDRAALPGCAVVKGVADDGFYPVQSDVFAYVYQLIDDRPGDEFRSVGLTDETIVTVTRDDTHLTIEIVGGPERFIRAQMRDNASHSHPLIRIELAPVTKVGAA